MSVAAENGEWTVGRMLNWTREWLAGKGIDEPRLATELLLAEAMGCAKIELYTRFDSVPGEPVRARFREMLRRAANHEPIAYLLGRKEFFSIEFEVSAAVLIPRPETEALVAAVVDHCRTGEDRAWTILDVGTGSGCIAVALAKYVPTARIVATDNRRDALDVAERNVARHEFADRIRLVDADWLDLPADARPSDGFDVIVSNPPYVSSAAMTELPKTVREFEPTAALDGGTDGLGAYRILAEAAPPALAPSGAVFVEVGEGQADAVAALFTDGGRTEHRGTWKDQARIERALQFTAPA